MSESEPNQTPTPSAPERNEPAESQAATAVAPPPARQESAKPANPRPRLDQLPPYRVLLHDDDVNEMGFVARTVRQLTGLPPSAARTVMLEAHTKGVALILVTHQERAELYREQFASKGLIVTIEPAG